MSSIFEYAGRSYVKIATRFVAIVAESFPGPGVSVRYIPDVHR